MLNKEVWKLSALKTTKNGLKKKKGVGWGIVAPLYRCSFSY
jgi:hypothetical protein